MAVERQWEIAAGERGLVGIEPIPVTWGRPFLPLTGPVVAATGSRRFVPLPGFAPARETQLAAGQLSDLHAVYGGLRSGRLVIAGAPGSGKSGAAVLLVLAALKHRDHVPPEIRPKVPVPVLFTAQDWNPSRQSVREWLIERLQETYTLFAGQSGTANAAGLIDAGKIALILDGLDEIAEELRPVALQALSQQANFRVVVLSRTAEMASAAASPHGVLQGAVAVELHAIDPATAADYLERVQLDPPPDGWCDLVDRIRTSPGSPLATALNSPLTLTLIRDTYKSAGDDARELLDFYDTMQQHITDEQASEDVTGHLLDRVLPAAYAHRPGQPSPRYDYQTAKNALQNIATRMNQDGDRDLEWWRIHRWASPAPRIIVVGLVSGLVIGLILGLGVGLMVGLMFMHGLGAGLVTGLGLGLVAGLIFGLVAGFMVEFGPGPVAGLGLRRGARRATLGNDGPPMRAVRPRLRRALKRRTVIFGLKAGLGAGLAVGLAAWLGTGLATGPGTGLKAGLAVGLKAGLIFGLVTGPVAGLVVGLGEALTDPDSTSFASPVASWHSDRKYGVMLGLVIGPGAGLVAGLMTGLVSGLVSGLVFGLAFGLGTALVVGLSASRVWRSSLAAAQLARRWHTPVDLIDFLDDARERDVLRTVGPVYQFRHARLQDRLAAAANADSSNDGNMTSLQADERLPTPQNQGK